jgi:phage baseplate assembly protein W
MSEKIMAYSVSNNRQVTTATSSTSSTGIGVFTGTYKGFITLAGVKSNQLYDIDIIKQDLINHFYTRRGERVMNPEFGSIIWDMLYEPLDESNKEEIYDDCKRIIANDPRVEMANMSVNEFESGLRIEIGINVLPYNKSATLLLNFERETL